MPDGCSPSSRRLSASTFEEALAARATLKSYYDENIFSQVVRGTHYMVAGPTEDPARAMKPKKVPQGVLWHSFLSQQKTTAGHDLTVRSQGQNAFPIRKRAFITHSARVFLRD